MILLDTDVMIDILRGYLPAKSWQNSLGKTPILLPGFVVMELIQGCQNKAEQRTLEAILNSCKKIWPNEGRAQTIRTISSQP